MTQSELAEQLRALHRGPAPLVLPNVWDVASARVIEELGFPALATTSAGIAFSLGYPDGQRISRDKMLAVVRRIAAAVRIPVSADIEAGYAETPEAVAETIRATIQAGAVGVNLEDAMADLSLQQERFRAAREAARATGVPLVLNARTDVYLHRQDGGQPQFDDAVRRLNAYLEAGADCAYPICARDPHLISELVRTIKGPINILAGPGAPTIGELERLGVRRVSFGSVFLRAAMTLMRRIATELIQSGTCTSFPEDTIPFAEFNRLFDRTRK
jgi:2-methylisocitrate lyase-like PEP mutase family enzyme